MSAELKQQVLDAVPATGEVVYDDLRQNLIMSGNQKALGQFHSMRRAGELAVRLNREDGKLYVARPAGGA